MKELEIENRDAVSLDVEFQRHKTKSKLREAELLEALEDKEREIAKLEKSLNTIMEERFQTSREELQQLSRGDTNEDVCVKCVDLQRLLDENKKVKLEFEKLTLDYEELQKHYELTTEDASKAQSRVAQLERSNEAVEHERDQLLAEIIVLREKLVLVQRDCETNTKTEDIERLNGVLAEARQELQLLQQKHDKLQTSWQQQQQTVSEIKGKYDALKDKYESVQAEYEQLKVKSVQSLEQCEHLEQQNDALRKEITALKSEIGMEASKQLREHNEELQGQLNEYLLQYASMETEYEVMSNQLMESVQEAELLRAEYAKLEERLKQYQQNDAAEQSVEFAALSSRSMMGYSTSRLETVFEECCCRRNSCRTTEKDPLASETLNNTAADVGVAEEIIQKFVKLSEQLQEVELEYASGRTSVFIAKQRSSQNVPHCKLYLRDIQEVATLDREDLNGYVGKVHMQGTFKRHVFDIVELDEGIIPIIEGDKQPPGESVEELKQQLQELRQAYAEQKALLESTECTIKELRGEMAKLSAELCEKSMLVDKCTCDELQRTIKERAEMSLVCEELQVDVKERTFTANEEQKVESQLVPDLETDQAKLKEKIADLEMDLEIHITKCQINEDEIEKLQKQCLEIEKTKNELQMEYQRKLVEMRATLEVQIQLEVMQELGVIESQCSDNLRKCKQEWEKSKESNAVRISALKQELAEQSDNPDEDALHDQEAIQQELIKLQQEQLFAKQQLLEGEQRESNLNERMQSLQDEIKQLHQLKEEKEATDKMLHEIRQTEIEREELIKSLEAELSKLKADKALGEQGPYGTDRQESVAEEFEKRELQLLALLKETRETAEQQLLELHEQAAKREELVKSLQEQFFKLKEEYAATEQKLLEAEQKEKMIQEELKVVALLEEEKKLAEEKLQEAHRLEVKQKEFGKSLQEQLLQLKEERAVTERKLLEVGQKEKTIQDELKVLPQLKEEKSFIERKLQETQRRELELEKLVKSLQDQLKEERVVTEQQLLEMDQKEKTIQDELKVVAEQKEKIIQEKLKVVAQLEEEKKVAEENLQEAQRQELKREELVKSLQEQLSQLKKEHAVTEQNLLKADKNQKTLQDELTFLAQLKDEKTLTEEKLQVALHRELELEKQIQSLKLQLEHDKAASEQLELIRNYLQNMPSELQKVYFASDKELQDIEQLVSNPEQLVKALLEKLSVLKDEKDAVQQKLLEFKQQQNDREELIRTYEDCLQKANELKAEKASLQQKLVEEALAKSNREIYVEKLLADLCRITKEKDVAEEQLQKANEKFSKLMEEKAAVEKTVHGAVRPGSNFEDLLQSLQDKVLAFAALLREKEQLESSFQSEKAKYETLLQVIQQERDDLQVVVDQLRKQKVLCDERQETLVLKTEALSQEYQKLSDKTTMLSNLVEEHEEREKLYDLKYQEQLALVAQLEAARAALDEVEQSKQALFESNRAQQAYIEELQEKLNSVEAEAATKVQRLEAMNAEQQKSFEHINSERMALERQQKEQNDAVAELKLKCATLEQSNVRLEQLYMALQQQTKNVQQKDAEKERLRLELQELRAQHNDMQMRLQATVTETKICSTALQKELAEEDARLDEQFAECEKLRAVLSAKQAAFAEERQKLQKIISSLLAEKKAAEEKLHATELAFKAFENEMTSAQKRSDSENTSWDSNGSLSPHSRKSLERTFGENLQLKSVNMADDKLLTKQQKMSSMEAKERKNRRLSAHDEHRRQSLWTTTRDVAVMTDPTDASCNCVELDRKLQDCERNLFIRESQVTALNMELKNHPLKAENAALKKRLQDELERNRIEIKKYKQVIVEQSTKALNAEKAAAAVAAAARAANSTKMPQKIVQNTETQTMTENRADAEAQTEFELDQCFHKLQSKYNDLKNICRHRYNVIKQQTAQIEQKENTSGNAQTPPYEVSQLKAMEDRCASLEKELKANKQKLENAKNMINQLQEEIYTLRARAGAATV